MLTRSSFLSGVLSAPGVAAISADAWNARSRPRKRALVLSGAASRGAYEAGVIVGLANAGYEFDLICGTSTGAINAALAAQGDLDALTGLWASMAARDLFAPKAPIARLHDAFVKLTERRGFFNRPIAFVQFLREVSRVYRSNDAGDMLGVFEPEPVIAALATLLSIDRVRTPFACGVTNVDLASPEAFFVDPKGTLGAVRPANYTARRLDPRRTADGARYLSAVRASCAFPIALDPVPIETGDSDASTFSYIDGGVTESTPLMIAHRLGATEILAVFVDTKSNAPRPSHSLRDVIVSMHATYDKQLIRMQADLIAASRNTQPASLYAIRPDPELVPAYDFYDQAALDAAFALGREDGHRGPVAFSA